MAAAFDSRPHYNLLEDLFERILMSGKGVEEKVGPHFIGSGRFKRRDLFPIKMDNPALSESWNDNPTKPSLKLENFANNAGTYTDIFLCTSSEPIGPNAGRNIFLLVCQ